MYKDVGDEYLTRYFDFRVDAEEFRKNLAAQSAGGGGAPAVEGGGDKRRRRCMGAGDSVGGGERTGELLHYDLGGSPKPRPVDGTLKPPVGIGGRLSERYPGDAIGSNHCTSPRVSDARAIAQGCAT